MRKGLPLASFRGQLFPPRGPVCYLHSTSRCLNTSQLRTLARVRDSREILSEVWFNGSVPSPSPAPPGWLDQPDHKAPDERTLKLGKTVRILHERLPTLLESPLPQEILSPQITLRLFPSTHPHLPAVSGKLAYSAALWTSPVAWGRVPVVGNVKLIIQSERMVRNGGGISSAAAAAPYEKLVVRWKTCGKTKDGWTEQLGKVREILAGRHRGGSSAAEKTDQDFYGLFIFEFDDKGRIVAHTIEHVQEGGNWEKTARVISVTDWLLGKAWGKREAEPGLALPCYDDDQTFSLPRGLRRKRRN